MLARLIEVVGGVSIVADRMKGHPMTGENSIASEIRRWTEDPCEFVDIDPFTRTARLIHATGSILPLQWLCGRTGCFFVHGAGYFSAHSARGAGATAWFRTSLQLHELRASVISAYCEEGSGGIHVTEDEGRAIARRWAAVVAWIQGYLFCQGQNLPSPKVLHAAHPVLFRSTEPWQAIEVALEGAMRNDVSEKVAYPFGEACRNRKAEMVFPKLPALNKWAKPESQKGTRGPLHSCLAFCEAVESLEPLHWLAAKSGGILVHPPHPLEVVPPSRISGELRTWERVVVELSELDAIIARACLDGEIAPEELEHMRSEWEDVVQRMGVFTGKW